MKLENSNQSPSPDKQLEDSRSRSRSQSRSRSRSRSKSPSKKRNQIRAQWRIRGVRETWDRLENLPSQGKLTNLSEDSETAKKKPATPRYVSLRSTEPPAGQRIRSDQRVSGLPEVLQQQFGWVPGTPDRMYGNLTWTVAREFVKTNGGWISEVAASTPAGNGDWGSAAAAATPTAHDGQGNEAAAPPAAADSGWGSVVAAPTSAAVNGGWGSAAAASTSAVNDGWGNAAAASRSAINDGWGSAAAASTSAVNDGWGSAVATAASAVNGGWGSAAAVSTSTANRSWSSAAAAATPASQRGWGGTAVLTDQQLRELEIDRIGEQADFGEMKEDALRDIASRGIPLPTSKLEHQVDEEELEHQVGMCIDGIVSNVIVGELQRHYQHLPAWVQFHKLDAEAASVDGVLAWDISDAADRAAMGRATARVFTCRAANAAKQVWVDHLFHPDYGNRREVPEEQQGHHLHHRRHGRSEYPKFFNVSFKTVRQCRREKNMYNHWIVG